MEALAEAALGLRLPAFVMPLLLVLVAVDAAVDPEVVSEKRDKTESPPPGARAGKGMEVNDASAMAPGRAAAAAPWSVDEEEKHPSS